MLKPSRKAEQRRSWLSLRRTRFGGRMRDLLALRRVRLFVEELEDRSTPSANPYGVNLLDDHFIGQQQLASLRGDASQVRIAPDLLGPLYSTRGQAEAFAQANHLPPPPHQVILVDSAVPDLKDFVAQLEEGLPPGAWYDLYVIDATHGGVQQITDILSQYHHELDAVHLFSHGSSGELLIGADLLDSRLLSADAAKIAGWRQALVDYGDLLLYGCDVSAGTNGAAFVEQLHQLTGLDIAASTNDTGSALLGGDWTLETHLGEIGAASLSLAGRDDAWSGLLNTYTVLNTNNSGLGSFRQAIIDANGHAGADTIAFNIVGVGTQTINLSSVLPNVTDTVTIDATSQLGYSGTPLVVLNGGNTVAGGLTLAAGSSGSTIRGLAMENFTGTAIAIIGGSANNLIAGNYLGTDATGTANAANGGWGINLLSAGSGNTIGGTTAATRNVIVANALGGIALDGASVTGTTIQGNFIGVGSDGTTALGNQGGGGIVVRNSSQGNLIGGTVAGAGNVIAFNAVGIQVLLNPAQALIEANSIYGNAGLGIDLNGDGVTPNDPGDGDSGGNFLKNFPTLASAQITGSSLTITGSINSVATGSYRIEFFASDVGDASGYGEGQRFLGFVVVTTDGSGNAAFSVTFTSGFSPGDAISSTNTDLGRAVTSEFSANLIANTPPVITSGGGGASANISSPENAFAVTTVTATDPDGDPLTYTIIGGADAAAFTIDPFSGLLSFIVAPDFENPTDVGANNVYNVTVQVDDGSGHTVSQALAITVTNVNEAPILTLPASQVTAKNATLTFSAANGNLLSVADDSGSNPISVTLSVSSGRLTLGTVAGLTFTSGSGVNSASMTFRGSQSAVNTALAGMSYTPALNFLGIDNLQVTINDLGNTGSGGAQVTTGSVEIETVQEYLANSTVVHNQTNPTVAFDAYGNFVMAWVADGNQDGDKHGVFARRFDSSGNPLGLEFQVNTTWNDEQQDPSIAMDADGDFVIVWMSNNQDGNGHGVYGQCYNATGAKVGGEFRVNTTTSGNQDAPAVAMDASGDFVVVWRSDRGGVGSDIYGQRYNSAGVAQGSEFRVNLNVTDNQNQPAVAVDASGNFVVTWRSNKQDGSGAGVFARMFTAAGAALSGEIAVNTTNSGDQNKPAIARNASGAFVIAWASNNQDGDKYGIFARQFAADGTPQGAEFQVNVTWKDAQDRPTVGIDDTGAFTIAWSSNNQDGSEHGVYARRFAADGTPTTGEFRVSGTTQKQQDFPAAAMDGIGDLVIGWQGNGLGDTQGVFYQLYRSVNDPPAISVPAGQTLFKNGGLVFSTAGGNGVTLSDPDAGAAAEQLTISVAHGTLTFAQTAGLTFTQGDGFSDASIIVSGSLAALNAALNGMSYTPTAFYAGADALQISVNDLGNTGTGGPQTTNAPVNLTISNRAPSAGNDAFGLNEDTPLTVAAAGVLGNDTDPDGDPLSAALVAGPANGTLTLNANGSFTYTPNANFNGADTFTYRAFDGTAFSNIATVTLTVAAVNDAPVAANPGNQSVLQDGTLAFSSGNGNLISIADVDAASGAMQVSLSGSNGTLSLSTVAGLSFTIGDGVSDANLQFTGTLAAINAALNGMTFSPTPNYYGSAGLGLVVSDLGNTGSGGAKTDSFGLGITVVHVNHAPVANADNFTTNEDTPLTVSAAAGVLANDSDPDADPLSTILVAGPTHGSLTLNADGSFTYTPNANYNGSDSFTYQASDGSLQSNIATVSLTINPVNDAPVAVGDGYTLNEDTPLTVSAAAGVLANDSDIDSPTLTAVLVSGPANGTLTLNPDGSFTYSPNANYNGADSFTYQASDGSMLSNVVTVSFTINAVNDAPVAVNDVYTLNEDTPLTISAAAGLLANDSDIDSPILSAVLVSGPTHGTLTLNPDGSFTYTPNANYNGTDSFNYQASDGSLLSNVATVSFTINAVNDAPVAGDDAYTLNEDTPLTVSAAAGLLANDSDVDSPTLTTILVAGPTHGTLTLNADGSFTYAADANYNGSDSFTYQASDGSLLSNVATVTFTINAVNDAPVAADDGYTLNEDTPLTIAAATGVLANDSDIDSPTLTTVLVTGPTHGTLTLNADGSFTYSPDANYNGSDSFTYQASDGSLLSNVATVSFTINAVNDAPVAVDDAYTLNEDTPITISAATGLLANDSDIDSPTLTVVLVTGPTHGTLTLNADGSFAYAPNANYNGSDSFTYQTSDGSLLSNVAAVTFTINPVNDAPVAADDGYTLNEDTPLTINAATGVLANDSDIDSPTLTAVLVNGPTHGTLALNADGSFTYTPDANFNGFDSFTYQTSDGSLLSNVATVSFTINAVNDAPVAGDDAYTLNEDTPLAVDSASGLLANDSDVDGPALTTLLVSGPTHGTLALNGDGSFTYTPNANYNGADSFTYQTSDGSLLSNIATVTLTVNAVNDAPVAADDSYFLNEDTPLIVAAPLGVLANDTDVDNPSLSAILVTGPMHGLLQFNADGSFTYSPDANYNGTDAFTYEASDGVAASNIVTVSLSIASVNDAPQLIDASNNQIVGTIRQGTSATVSATSIVGLATDVDGDPLTTELVAGPAHGTLARGADGSFLFTPDTTYFGTDQFLVRVTDGALHSAVITVLIDVQIAKLAPPPINAPPLFGGSGGNSTSTNEGLLTSYGTGGGRGLGASSQNFGVSADDDRGEGERSKAIAAANAQRADFASGDKNHTIENVVARIGNATRLPIDDRWSALLHPAPSVAPLRFQAELWQQQSVQLYQALDDVGKKVIETAAARNETVLVVGGAAVTMTASYVLWSLRGFYMLLSALTARPLWRHFDPLVVLDRWERREDEDDVEKMFD